MERKIKNKLLLGLIIFLTIIFGGYVFARAPEVTYPQIVPGVSPPTGQTDIGGYIRYLYVSLIALGGILSLGALIWGGFRFLTSAGNPAAMADAREQIFYGIIGLFILLGSYIFLRELNPQTVAPFVPPLKAVGRGIIAYSDQSCGNGANGLPGVLQPLPENLRYERVETVKKLSNDSITVQSFWTFEKSDDIFVEFYTNSDCSGAPVRRFTDFNAETCIDTGSIQNVKCIKVLWHTPGVYLFSNARATLENIPPNTSYNLYKNSAGSLPTGINDNVRTLGLSWDTKRDIYYGAILHRNPGATNEARGWSTIFLPAQWRSSAGVVSDNVERDSHLPVVYYRTPRWRDASSVTVFQVVREEANEWWIEVCRNIDCRPQPGCPGMIKFYPWRNEWRRANWKKQGDQYVLNWDEVSTSTDFTIDGLDSDVVRGINLFGDTDGYWCSDSGDYNNDEHLKIASAETTRPLEPDFGNGVSAVLIHPSAKFILSLHSQREAGDGAAVAVTSSIFGFPTSFDTSLITSASLPNLTQVDFDNQTSAIRVIKGIIQ